MKLLIIVNHETDTFETCLPSRDLSAEELRYINQLMEHGIKRTCHYVETGDRPLPFGDIVEALKIIIEDGPMEPQEHTLEKLNLLPGLPIKVAVAS